MRQAHWGWVFIAAALAIVAVVVWNSPAWPQSGPKCGPKDAVMEYLKQRYQEVPTFSATGGTDHAVPVDVTLSPTGSWSLVVHRPDGTSCIMAGGLDWKEGPPGKDA